jgi:xylulokinase
MRAIESAGDGPTGILFFPYLRGGGGVHSDDHMRAAFVGLDASHEQAHLLKAVWEGTAYEAESIRRAAECLIHRPIDELIVVGGGAADTSWAQIRADVSGCRCILPDIEEATGVGAALLAGLGYGILSSPEDVLAIANSYRRAGTTVYPDDARHARYRELYETGYVPVGKALRTATRAVRGEKFNDG